MAYISPLFMVKITPFMHCLLLSNGETITCPFYLIVFRPNGPSFSLNSPTIRIKRWLFGQKTIYLKRKSYYFTVTKEDYNHLYLQFIRL
jgi:hypothetical protein